MDSLAKGLQCIKSMIFGFSGDNTLYENGGVDSIEITQSGNGIVSENDGPRIIEQIKLGWMGFLTSHGCLF